MLKSLVPQDPVEVLISQLFMDGFGGMAAKRAR
jgi:hypothetical protein